MPLNLDQLQVFAMVEAEGSFSAAARRLGRAQSAITYAIQELEADLNTPLFDRSAYRPVLSAAGRALLPRAQRVLQEAKALQAQADGIAGGLEPTLSLVVDAMFPMLTLVEALQSFQALYPSVVTRMHVGALGAAADMVMEGEVDLGLVLAWCVPRGELERRTAGMISLTLVCAPTHPLATRMHAHPRLIPIEEARDHLQLVLSDRSPRTREEDHGVISPRTWRIADLGAKHAMLRAGLGWGSLPHHLAADDIATGRLLELALEPWPTTGELPELEAVVVRRPDRPLGPAGQWLFARLSKEAIGRPQKP